MLRCSALRSLTIVIALSLLGALTSLGASVAAPSGSPTGCDGRSVSSVSGPRAIEGVSNATFCIASSVSQPTGRYEIGSKPLELGNNVKLIGAPVVMSADGYGHNYAVKAPTKLRDRTGGHRPRPQQQRNVQEPGSQRGKRLMLKHAGGVGRSRRGQPRHQLYQDPRRLQSGDRSFLRRHFRPHRSGRKRLAVPRRAQHRGYQDRQLQGLHDQSQLRARQHRARYLVRRQLRQLQCHRQRRQVTRDKASDTSMALMCPRAPPATLQSFTISWPTTVFIR